VQKPQRKRSLGWWIAVGLIPSAFYIGLKAAYELTPWPRAWNVLVRLFGLAYFVGMPVFAWLWLGTLVSNRDKIELDDRTTMSGWGYVARMLVVNTLVWLVFAVSWVATFRF